MNKITFEKETKLINFNKDQPKRIIFSFDRKIRGLVLKLNITLELLKTRTATQFPEYTGSNITEVDP